MLKFEIVKVPQLPQLRIEKRTGDEPFSLNGQPLELTLREFWQWSSSDLVDNTMRGVLAEFIVASALGVTRKPRVGWDAYDLETPTGIKVEVKSAAYLQSWFQKTYSSICFNIRPTRRYDGSTNELDTEVKRQADVYVFCLLKEKDKSKVDPLNLNQWLFFILPAAELNKRFPIQKTIGLSALKSLAPREVRYGQIKSCLEELFSLNPKSAEAS